MFHVPPYREKWHWVKESATANRTSPICACTKSNVSRAVGTQPFGTNDKVRGDQREWSMN